MKKTSFTSLAALLLALLTLILPFGLTSCADQGDPAGSGSPADSQTAAPEQTSGETEPAPTETEAATEPSAPASALRAENFANGILSDKLLDSVNPGVLSLLSMCTYYDSVMKSTTKEGKKWVYSNSSTYVPQSGTFDSLVKSGKVGTNCAMPQGWALIDLGIVPNGKHFYGDSAGGLANLSSLGKYLSPVATITSWEGTVKFSTLYNRGDVMPGDIFYAKGHTFIYLGDEKFMAAGHDGDWHTDNSAPTEDSRHAVFENWICDMKSNSDWSYTVYWQVRFKDEYVPRFFRNKAGELVANPDFSQAVNIEYKAGKSPEQAEVIYKVERFTVYDDSGRTNVLQDVSFGTSQAFNLGKFAPPANLTDGQLYYDNTEATYTDIKLNDINARYNAAGKPGTGDDYKYICGFYGDIGSVKKVDGFSLYSQAVGASSGTPIGDIDGFDILVSTDGVNWTVVYSVTEAASGGKWIATTEAKNKSSKGYPMCHYIRADFDAVDARYVMFALTDPRTQKAPAEGVAAYDNLTTINYFRFAEFQMYEKK